MRDTNVAQECQYWGRYSVRKKGMRVGREHARRENVFWVVSLGIELEVQIRGNLDRDALSVGEIHIRIIHPCDKRSSRSCWFLLFFLHRHEFSSIDRMSTEEFEAVCTDFVSARVSEETARDERIL